MEHKCTLEHEDSVLDKLKWHQKIRMISPDNPLRLGYFRSDIAIKNEKLRHLNTSNCTIHPFSKFSAWYEMYLIFLYGSALITKPVDAGFIKMYETNHLYHYRFYAISTDVLSWIDILCNFFIGLEVDGTKLIELRARNIAKSYVFGKYFIFDVLSSIPKCLMYFVPGAAHHRYRRHIAGVLTLVSLFKFIRIISFIKCIKRTAEYFGATAKGMLFLLCSFVVSALIIHWMACLQFAVPKLIRRLLTPVVQETSWYHADKLHQNLYDKSVIFQYMHCLFKSTAYILGIRIDLYKMTMPEEYLLAIITYFIGKILIAFIWIILAVAILNSRLMDIKFLEVMNQLEEYMRQKQLPLNLRDRILQYFLFKYKNRFFKEELVNSLLSNNLRREANLHVCRSLVKNVSLFCELTPIEISKIVNYLIPEIFLPNDTIIHAGTYGDAMYFLSSGTVAVYTRSGKEICHLQDGAYFGEISLVLKGQLRLTTILALETSHVYRLNKKDLDKCLLINKTIKINLLRVAEARLKEATHLEEEYKQQMYEQSFKKMPGTP